MKIDKLTPESEVLAVYGQRLARIRKQRGLTQDRLAAAAGVGVATLRRLESGQDAQIGTWIRLLKALEMDSILNGFLPERYDSPMTEVLGQRKRAARRATEGQMRWGDESA
jgi:transcriptional regulator with XRE-family HTH domain